MTDRLREAAQAALDDLEARCGTNAPERGPDGSIAKLRAALAEQDHLEHDLDMVAPTVKDRLQVAVQAALDVWASGIGMHPRMGAALRELRAALAEQKWTPDDTAHRPGGLAQEHPVMDLGDFTEQTSGLRGGLMQTVALAKQEVEPAPEPVTWRWKLVPDGMWHYSDMAAPPPYQSFPLYTHPPRREWQSLDGKELEACFRAATSREWGSDYKWVLYRAIEAALKEKNHE